MKLVTPLIFPDNTSQSTAGAGGGGATAVDVTATGYGETYTLPDATTLSVGATYIIKNSSAYDKRLKNYSGVVLGFIPAFTDIIAVCQTNSTSGGIWGIPHLSPMGVVADKTFVTSLGTPSGTPFSINLDSTRQLLITSSGAVAYGVIFDSSDNTWGSVTALMNTYGTNVVAIKTATDQVMVLGHAGGTTMRTSVVSISGKTISGTTVVDTTLAGNLSSFGNIIAVGTSWVVSYQRATTISGTRAITISGTTPTIGSESTNSGTAAAAHLYANTSSTYTSVSYSTSALVVKTDSVSGSTITAGTQVTSSMDSGSNIKTMMMGTGRIAVMFEYITGRIGLISVSGTTPTLNVVGFLSTITVNNNDWVAISSTKILVASATAGNWYLTNIVDSSGTPSSGILTIASAQAVANSCTIVSVSGNNARCTLRASSGNNLVILSAKIDASGTTPSSTYTSLKSVVITGGATPNFNSVTGTIGGAFHPSSLVNKDGIIVPSGYHQTGSYLFLDTISKVPNTLPVGAGITIYGQNRQEGWASYSDSGFWSLTKVEVAP